MSEEPLGCRANDGTLRNRVLPWRVEYPVTDKRSGIARVNLESRNILGYNAASCRNAALIHGHAGTDHGARPDPGAVAKDDGFRDKTEGGIGPVMVAGAEISPLRNAHIVPNRDLRQIVDPYLFAYPGAVPEREEPRVFNANARLDDN